MRDLHILIIGQHETQDLNLHTFTKKHFGKINKLAPGGTITLVPDSKKEINKFIKDVHIIITPDISLINIDKAENLEWVHITKAGVFKAIDVLFDSEVILTNSSGVHPIPISEHVFGFLLMLARRLNFFYKSQVTKKAWETKKPKGIFELHRKTIGIIGFGRIGDKVAHIAKGFDMHVLAVSTSHRYQPEIDSWYPIDKLHNVLEQSDFVINALPLTHDTKNLFDKKAFAAMKEGAIFINIGRGETVNEKALINALKSGHVAGAGLDVFAKEPLPKTSPLWKMDNVIITPHDAGRTPHYVDRLVEIFCKNLRAFLGTRKMPTLVDKERGY